MSAALVWEEVETPSHLGYMWRSRTPTGWLVRETQDVTHHIPDRGLDSGYDWRVSLTFVPDPDGLWLAERA